MAGVITVKCTVMKDGQKQLGMVNGKSPIFIPGPVQPQFGPGRMLYFEVRLTARPRFPGKLLTMIASGFLRR